jgi:hypothetical protein
VREGKGKGEKEEGARRAHVHACMHTQVHRAPHKTSPFLERVKNRAFLGCFHDQTIDKGIYIYGKFNSLFFFLKNICLIASILHT